MILNYTTRQIICGLGFDLWRLRKRPWAAAVLVDEFDAGTVRVPPLLFRLFGLLRPRTARGVVSRTARHNH
jgi:hypothetical protein